jgi:hypothetical protein
MVSLVGRHAHAGDRAVRAAAQQAQELAAGARGHVEIDDHQARPLGEQHGPGLGVGLDTTHAVTFLDGELEQKIAQLDVVGDGEQRGRPGVGHRHGIPGDCDGRAFEHAITMYPPVFPGVFARAGPS